MFIKFGIAGWTLHHRSIDMSGLQPAALNLPDIDGVNPIDKIAIPLLLRIKIRTERSVHKNIDNVAKAEKEIEMKAFQKEWKDVLSADTFESKF